MIDDDIRNTLDVYISNTKVIIEKINLSIQELQKSSKLQYYFSHREKLMIERYQNIIRAVDKAKIVDEDNIMLHSKQIGMLRKQIQRLADHCKKSISGLNNKTAYGAVIQTLDSGLNNNSLALVKYNSTTTDDLITHLTDKGNYLYVIYTDTNTDIPVYTVKNKTVYMYSVSDAAGQSQDSMFKPIASISIKKLNRTVNDNYLKQYTPKIKLLDATNMNQDDVNNQIDQITMGSNNN